MAEFDQGAHLCVPLVPPDRYGRVTAPQLEYSSLKLLVSYFITFDTVGRYGPAGPSIFVQPEPTKLLHFRDMS